MAGTIKTNAVQLGDSATDSQNFLLKTNVDGTATLARGATGSLGNVLTVDASGVVTATSGLVTNRLVSGTAVASTSGTSIDFTGIPSWVKRITVMYSSVSLNSTGAHLIQLGTSGGVQTTGYDAVTIVGSAGSTNTVNASVAGFPMFVNAATYALNGAIVFTLLSGSTWVAQGVFANGTTVPLVTSVAGTKTLSGTLDRVRLTTTTGTDTFDAGSVNILYEG